MKCSPVWLAALVTAIAAQVMAKYPNKQVEQALICSCTMLSIPKGLEKITPSFLYGYGMPNAVNALVAAGSRGIGDEDDFGKGPPADEVKRDGPEFVIEQSPEPAIDTEPPYAIEPECTVLSESQIPAAAQ